MIQADKFLMQRRPTAERPLLGQTVLVVEDSRFAGETMRLMCLRGGARIRRADSLRAAERHLASYRPSIVLVDPGLPDGSGLELLGNLARQTPRVPVLVAVSGDPSLEDAAFAAGADSFLTKPFGSVAAFHNALIGVLPMESRPTGLRLVADEIVIASGDALMDDFALIADLLDGVDEPTTLSYALSFAHGLGRSAGDTEVTEAVEGVLAGMERGDPAFGPVQHLRGIVQRRLGPGVVAV